MMQYSPKLKMAAEDIKDVLKKYDIAAVVVLHTPGFSEYLFAVTPTYSCAELDGGRFRVKIKLSHYNDDKKMRDRFVKDTTNMMYHLSHITGTLAMNLLEASKILDETVQADHVGGGHSSHESQNN